MSSVQCIDYYVNTLCVYSTVREGEFVQMGNMDINVERWLGKYVKCVVYYINEQQGIMCSV